MKYAPLTHLRMRHPAYPEGRCDAVGCEPTPDTGRALARHRLLLHARPDGFDLVGPVLPQGEPALPFTGLALRFALHTRRRELLDRTDLDELQTLQAPTWRRKRSGKRLQLQEGSEPLRPGSLARVELTGIGSTWLRKPRTFELQWSPRRLTWVYYLLSKRAGQTPHIVDPDPKRRLEFEGGPLVGGVELAKKDAFGASPLRSRPERSCVRLTSIQPVSCNQPSAGLTLRLEGETSSTPLPTPSPERKVILSLPGDSSPRAGLACVVEY